MNTFIVRVELHGYASEATYIKLHEVMERAGFVRAIRADNGAFYALPQAMYTTSSFAATDTIRQSAIAAAATTGHATTIFVAQMTEWSASGLSPVPAYATTPIRR